MPENQRLDFGQVIDKYGQKLFNLLLRLTGNYHLAQDLSQDVLLIAFKEYPKFRGDSDVFTWIYRIAINHYRKQMRKSRLKSMLGFDEVPGDALSTEPNNDPAEQDEQNRAVAQAVTSLPLGFKETIVLHYFQDQSCEKIAEIMGCSEGTVKSRLYRGRKILAQKLKGFVSETGV